MEKLNFARIIIGGLLAGLIINIVDVPNSIFLAGPKLQTLLKAQHVTQSKFIPPYFITIHFVLGVALVFLYAALKPAFGGGLGTVLIATLVLLVVQRMFTLGQVFLGQLSFEVFISLSWSLLLGSFLGSLAGRWFYER